jgi:hypothetical protein
MTNRPISRAAFVEAGENIAGGFLEENRRIRRSEGKESARRRPAQLLRELDVSFWLTDWTWRSNPISQTARSA